MHSKPSVAWEWPGNGGNFKKCAQTEHSTQVLSSRQMKNPLRRPHLLHKLMKH